MYKIVFMIFFFISNIVCEEVYLTATKVGTPYVEMDSINTVVITKSQIEKIQANSLSDVLRFYGIDIYSRSDMQTDVSLYGGTFQQVKIFINGIPVDDPQTAHHNFNLPIPLEDIEKIEIQKSVSSAIYGTGAFSGTINIITKKPEKKFTIKSSYGTHDTGKILAHISSSNSGFTVEKNFSSGYRTNTDYKSTMVNAIHQLPVSNLTFDLTLSYLDKSFGAQDFYVLNREEYEHIKTLFSSLSTKYNISPSVSLDSKIYFRHHYDNYTTRRYQPQIYSNYHNSYLYGLNLLSMIYLSRNYNLELGLESKISNLDSKGFSTALPNWKGLGKFYDIYNTLSLQFNSRVKKLASTVAIRGDTHSRFGERFSSAVNLRYDVNKNLAIKTSVGKVYRYPSYTELYYWDPAHETKQELKVEETIRYDSGLEYSNDLINISLLGFMFDSFNLIDWMRTKGTTVWRISNIAKSYSYGVDMNFSVKEKIFWRSLTAGVTTVNKKLDLPENIELKYGENYPKLQGYSSIVFKDIFSIEPIVSIMYKNLTKTNPKEFLLTDIDLSKTINKNLKFKLKIKNLFDTRYEEIPNVSQPGREFFAGCDLYIF